MNPNFSYPAELGRDKAGDWLVTFPDVPEAGTDDKDRAQAMIQAGDALLAALEGYVAARRPLPQPSKAKRGQVLVSLPPLAAAKAALYEAMRTRRLTKVALARRLGVSETVVRRLIDLRHASRIDAVCAALAALGLEAELVIRKAA